MAVLNQLYFWTDAILYWGVLALHVWAAIDCATRKAAAFPAADKLTKPSWLAITLLAVIFPLLPPFSAPIGPISLVATIAAAIYLADVRPAVREIASGR